jgi:ABC-type phosphate/phosphonate transport system substrate-binding protein
MYDWPEIRTATDDWWDGLRRAFEKEGLGDVPAKLSRGGPDDAAWSSGDLLLSQTCGYPYTHGGSATLRLVATPCYGVSGCEGPNYRSFVLARKETPQTRLEDFRNCRAVINDFRSQSGFSALRAVIAPLAGGKDFFNAVITSGGHRISMEMVGTGKADLCAVDAVCLALAERYVPDLLAPLRIIASSPGAPSLPYVTAKRTSDETLGRLRTGLKRALEDPGLDGVRKALFLSGTEVLGDSAYQRILEIENTAIGLGYPGLR